MRRVVCLLAFSLLFGFAVSAQDQDTGSSSTKADVFLGYTYVRQTYKNGIPPYNQHVCYEWRVGAICFLSGEVVCNRRAKLQALNPRTSAGTRPRAAMYTYMFGPRIVLHHGRLRPYVQGALRGSAYDVWSELLLAAHKCQRNGQTETR